jgi:hypothetical protein
LAGSKQRMKYNRTEVIKSRQQMILRVVASKIVLI